MQDTQQLDLWRSSFGQEYTDRNDREKPERIAAWRELLDGIDVKSAIEVGCNAGWNLAYLTTIGIPEVVGIEPQPYAVARAKERGFVAIQGTAFALPAADASFDLAFTSGVLIHIAPSDLGRALDELYRVSRRYLVAIEYDHTSETEVAYRGHAGALWKRDHGATWQSRYPDLKVVKKIFLDEARGYDDCTAYLFEKV